MVKLKMFACKMAEDLTRADVNCNCYSENFDMYFIHIYQEFV